MPNFSIFSRAPMTFLLQMKHRSPRLHFPQYRRCFFRPALQHLWSWSWNAMNLSNVRVQIAHVLFWDALNAA